MLGLHPGVVKKIDAGRLLGVAAFVLALITMTYAVFGPTYSFTKSATIVKDENGERVIGQVVSGTTSSYKVNDPALLFIPMGVVVAAGLGAAFAWRRRKFSVIAVGLLLAIFSGLAMFSIGLFVLPVDLVFLASSAFLKPTRSDSRRAPA